MAFYSLFEQLQTGDVFHYDESCTVIERHDFKKCVELIIQTSNDTFSLFLDKEKFTVLHDDGYYIVWWITK